MIELIFDIFNQDILFGHIEMASQILKTKISSVFFSIEWIRLWSYIIPSPSCSE